MAKILLADDSGTAQRMGAQILSAEGHEVNTVSNGSAAIKTLAKFSPDLIVADVFMPGKTGYELCEFVKSDPDTAWIPVLLIVAPMEPYDATEGQRVKADGLVTKPLDRSNLVDTVQALLASAKRPAPPPKKRGAKAAAAAEPASPEPAEPHEPLPEEDPTIPAISTTAASAIEIPEEMRNQPVSLVGELLEPEAIEREPSVPEDWLEPEAIERELPAEEGPAEETAPVLLVENDSPEITQDPLLISGTETVEPEGLARLFADAEKFEQHTPFPEEPETAIPAVSTEEFAGTAEPQSPVPAAPPEPSWTANPVDIAENDKKLFASEQPDWQGLVSLVQEEDQQGHFPAVSSAVGAPAPSAEKSADPHVPATPEQPPPNAPRGQNAEPHPELLAGPEVVAEEAPNQPDPAPAPEAQPAVLNDPIAMMVPQIAPLDYATVEQIVRETLEEVMPQIMDRISQATGMRFQKNEPAKEPPKE